MRKRKDNLSHARKTYMRSILNSYPDICNKPPEQRTRNEQRRVDLVYTVLDAVEHMPDAAKRRALIDMVYFQQSHGLVKAAVQIPIDRRTAEKWNAEVIEVMIDTMQLP